MMRPIQPILSELPGSKLLFASLRACGIPARMPAMMIIDTPFPIPNRSICSPIHIRKIVPAVSVATAIVHHRPLFTYCGMMKSCERR